MRFFNCRVESGGFRLKFGSEEFVFLTSEKGPNNKRRYTLRTFNLANGKVSTVGAFCQMSRKEGHIALKRAMCANSPEELQTCALH